MRKRKLFTIRGLLLLDVLKGYLKPYVDDSTILVKDVNSHVQTIKYLEYLGMGIKCCAAVFAGLALYQHLRK